MSSVPGHLFQGRYKAILVEMDENAKELSSLYLCRKHSGEKLGTIGPQFGIGDAAVAQSCKRFKLKLENDRKLREKIERFEKMVLLANVETFLFSNT